MRIKIEKGKEEKKERRKKEGRRGCSNPKEYFKKLTEIKN